MTRESGKSNRGASGHLGLWLGLACCVIALVSGMLVRSDIDRANETVERLILQGPEATAKRIMHHVTIERRDGTTFVDVSGTASPAQLRDLIRALEQGEECPDTWKTTTWTTAGGTKITIKTPPQPGEVPLGSVHCDRHDAFVAEIQEEFPPA